MTKLQATIMSLTLITSFAALPGQAQTAPVQQDNRATAQQAAPSSKRAPKRSPGHAAHTSSAPQSSQSKQSQPGAKPQGSQMEGMQGMEGMQHETSTPAPTEQEQQSKPPQPGEQQPGQ